MTSPKKGSSRWDNQPPEVELKQRRTPLLESSGVCECRNDLESYRLRRRANIPRESSPRADKTKLEGSGTTSAK